MSDSVQMETAFQPYDFKRLDQISKNQLQALNFIHNRFAKNMSAALSGFLRTMVEVNQMATAQSSYAHFLESTTDPTCYAAMSLHPLAGNGAIEIPPDILFPIIDRLLGGEGRPIAANRPMTDIEKGIIQNLLKMFATELGSAWKQVHTIDFKIIGTEANPRMIQVIAPADKVMQVEFEIRMNEVSAKIRLAISAGALEPVFKGLNQEPVGKKKSANDETVVLHLRTVPVGLSIETPETMFPMQSILSLQAGDTLLLDHRSEWPLPLKVSGKTKLYANPRNDTKRKAFTITAPLRANMEEV